MTTRPRSPCRRRGRRASRRASGKVIIILGADHHGYVGRMRAVAACFGDDPDQTLEILIGQLVNLVRDGEPVRMSKRASPIDLDLDLWTRASNDNPVYSMQYAHAI